MLGLILGLSLVGCNNQKQPTDQSTESSTQLIQLRVQVAFLGKPYTEAQVLVRQNIKVPHRELGFITDRVTVDKQVVSRGGFAIFALPRGRYLISTQQTEDAARKDGLGHQAPGPSSIWIDLTQDTEIILDLSAPPR